MRSIILIMKKHMKIFIVILLLLIATLLYQSCGGYPFAEKYTIKISSDKVISAIKQMKADDSTLTPKEIINLLNETGEVGTKYIDGRSYWYYTFFDFYISSRDELYRIYLRDSVESKKLSETRIGLISVCTGNDLRTCRLINSEFTCKENKEKKKFFEEAILKEIIERAEKLK